MTDYEPDRRRLKLWTKEHYIDQFGLSGKLLDAGCGDGFWSSIFDEFEIFTVGIDKDRQAIELGLKRWPHLDLRILDIMEAHPGYPEYDFDWVFARTLPCFYQSKYISPAIGITRKLLSLGDRLLLSMYSTQSNALARSGHWHFPVQTFRSVVIAAGGKVDRTVVVGNYIQIAARAQ